ncbi:penicillin acylase family protein [Microlunatus speluncae]|uniref:penicillin acylase family protein n=1 Tax=Microlunatus speluncae TaxID=2594267 RepID=UPI0012661050|nr:penicillin acylase family protein [Microlunatus speluncae]
MPGRLPRWLILTVIVVVLALGGLSSLGVGTVRRSFPQTTGEIALPVLSGPVEVLRDANGVPHLYADDPQDLFAAQGFVHAQDRFFEMDLRRHITAGRLSELFGPSQVTTDAFTRTMGWRRVAEQELELLSAKTRRYLDAYASGVNAYLRERGTSDLSLEYTLLGVQGLSYEPEDWTAVDSLAWLKAMAWDLGANRGQEIDQALTAAVVGEDRAAELWPDHPMHDFDPIVTTGAVRGGAFDPRARPATGAAAALTDDQRRAAVPALRAVEAAAAGMPDLLAPDGIGSEVGSNSWVIAGSRTASGKPILGNDPHLATSIPSVFTQVGLHCRQVTDACPFDVSGFSFAGMPGVIIGKNSKISWGLTTSYVDAQDLYLEELRGNTVRVGDGFQELDVHTEPIKVEGEEKPRTLIIRSSKHGPILSDVDPDLQDLSTGQERDDLTYGIAMSWAALTPSRSMDGIFDLNRATDFDQFRAALGRIGAPSQNLVYADLEGNIGYQLAGQVPQRGKGDGRTLSPGWDSGYDWRGMLPYQRLPYSLNPESGYIVASNQPITGPGYPDRLGSDYSYGWRSQEVADRLRDATGVTLDQAEQLFYDDTNRFAADLVPLLLKVKVSDPWVAEGQTSLVGWDYGTDADSAAAAYFGVVINTVLEETFHDELPERLWPGSADRWYGVLSRLIEEPDDPWWDDVTTPDVTEQRDDILLAAMTQARKEITALVARDPGQWQWGKLHRITLRHQTLGESGIPPVEAMFNRGDFAAPGGPAVVNAMGYDLSEPYRVINGPTMRMLVDLADLDQSRWVNQSGVSGHAYHQNYDDQTELWVTNRLWAFRSGRDQVAAAATERLVLSPGQ